jgi:hypothetical protein
LHIFFYGIYLAKKILFFYPKKMKKQITVILGVVTFTTLSLLIAFPDQVTQWLSPTEENITWYGEVQQPAEQEAPLLTDESSQQTVEPPFQEGNEVVEEFPTDDSTDNVVTGIPEVYAGRGDPVLTDKLTPDPVLTDDPNDDPADEPTPDPNDEEVDCFATPEACSQ